MHLYLHYTKNIFYDRIWIVAKYEYPSDGGLGARFRPRSLFLPWPGATSENPPT